MTLETENLIKAMPIQDRMNLMYYFNNPDERHLSLHQDILPELDEEVNTIIDQMLEDDPLEYAKAKRLANMAVIELLMNPQVSEKSDFNPDKLTVVQLYDSHENHAGLYVTDILDENKVTHTIQSVFASVDASASEHTDIQIEADDVLAEHHGIYRKSAIPVDVEEI